VANKHIIHGAVYTRVSTWLWDKNDISTKSLVSHCSVQCQLTCSVSWLTYIELGITLVMILYTQPTTTNRCFTRAPQQYSLHNVHSNSTSANHFSLIKHHV